MKRNIIIMFIMLILISVNSYSKYKKEYSIEAIEIITDIESPTYTIQYSETGFTKNDVEVKIIFSEEIKEIEGFKKLNSLTYAKTLKENKSDNFFVSDMAGNITEVFYKVNWIDKIAPKITGIENNKTYTNAQYANYSDDISGIKKIEKVFYGDLDLGIRSFTQTDEYYEIEFEILRKPKNCKEIKFCKVYESIKQVNKTMDKTITYRIPVDEMSQSKFYAEAVGSNGNQNMSPIIDISNIEVYIANCQKYNMNENINTFSNPGNYDMQVLDNAGNETYYSIIIEK